MDEVIEQCQVTFEEDGINNQTLDDLRKVGPCPVHSYFFMRLPPQGLVSSLALAGYYFSEE